MSEADRGQWSSGIGFILAAQHSYSSCQQYRENVAASLELADVLAELERSWLFCLAPDSDADDTSIEAHAMKCRFESSLEVPPEVYQAPGTSVKRFRH